MNARLHAAFLTLIGVAVVLASCGQTNSPCPSQLRLPRLALMEGEEFLEDKYTLADHRGEPAHPFTHRDIERRVTVLSDSTISIEYERDGEIIVETYAVTGTAELYDQTF